MIGSPTVKRRRLSAELIRLREQAGLTHDEVAKRLEWSRGRLTHMEQNKWVLPDIGNVRLLLDLYNVIDPAVREAILDLARQSREKGWWAKYKDVFGGSLPGFEAEATQIRTVELVTIPGLLQTAAYATAVFQAGQVLDQAAVRRHVEARLARQAILTRDNPPQLWAVVDEAALRKMVGGPAVMAEQLARLVNMARQPNITVQVLPDSIGAHAAMGSGFVVLDFMGDLDPSLVYLETPTDNLFLERPEEVQAYALMFNRVVAAALTVEQSVHYVTALVDQLKQEER
ncbi:helix-turn-helix domain-containing protein [Streptosporangium amethystogenes]|uniref:helix-turn-helix domain-containing protein n=1 Tax=Streptosporangium amethystogenes TaxID=2002 RepID=UPI0004C50AA3|nr:helix-turn-helix transcriptional regulator [Streptosporangium amethystogenes]